MIYYKSNYLSKKTGVNPARWKRWVREFLPPDPLSGMQSGYARQFNLKDAFQVYLGGHLVQALKFNVTEARNILSDLSGWLENNGFFELTAGNGGPAHNRQANGIFHQLYIIPKGVEAFGYAIRSVKRDDSHLSKQTAMRENYTLTLIGFADDPIGVGSVPSARFVGITRLYLTFLKQIA